MRRYKKHKMSWEWIGAFFEGEGCFTIYSMRRAKPYAVEIRFHITQKDRAVLDAILKFMKKQGINSVAVYTKGLYIHQLNVSSKKDVCLALHNIIPYLFSKREYAIECLDWLEKTEALKEKHGLQYWRYVTPIMPPIRVGAR